MEVSQHGSWSHSRDTCQVVQWDVDLLSSILLIGGLKLLYGSDRAVGQNLKYLFVTLFGTTTLLLWSFKRLKRGALQVPWTVNWLPTPFLLVDKQKTSCHLLFRGLFFLLNLGPRKVQNTWRMTIRRLKPPPKPGCAEAVLFVQFRPFMAFLEVRLGIICVIFLGFLSKSTKTAAEGWGVEPTDACLSARGPLATSREARLPRGQRLKLFPNGFRKILLKHLLGIFFYFF